MATSQSPVGRAQDEASRDTVSDSSALGHEYNVLLQSAVEVINGLSREPKHIAVILHRKGFIAKCIHDEIIEIPATSTENARKLYTTVLDVVQLYPRRYREFISILQENTLLYGDLLKVLGEQENLPIETEEILPMQETGSPSHSMLAGEGVNVVDKCIQKINPVLYILKNEKLGKGAFGVVFKGTYRGYPCAVKVLHELAMEILADLPATGGGQDETKLAFERECKFLKSFQHPNVVEHLSTTTHPTSGHLILVTELMDCSLKHYLSCSDTLTEEVELSLCKNMASALVYIHSRNIVHRDLCGDNILVNKIGPIAKVSDFGMSRIIDCSTMSSTLTALGHRMGYLPPEAPLIEASRYDASLDVFSFGVIMTQIVHRLNTIKTPADRNFNVAQIEPDHPLKPIIVDCLNETKEERPSASTLYNRLGFVVSV